MSETTKAAMHLLNNVTLIKNKYDEIAKITGENFNIFKIFGKEYHENYHSAIISDLLNEKGSHGQGRLFLDLFIPIVNEKIIKKNQQSNDLKISEIADFHDSSSVTEKVIDDYDRIDIYLTSESQTIIIENKIGAPFQHRQLKRYFDYASKGKNFVILYLWVDIVTFEEIRFNQDPWPFGKPGENSNDVKAKTMSISYKEDVKNWIELCIKECSRLPLIREVLVQYLYTINKITNQSTNIKMEKEIIDTIIGKKGNINKETIKAFFELSKIKLAPAILERLIFRLKESDKFERITYDENCIGNNAFEIDIFKEEFKYVVKIYFHNIDNAIIGVYQSGKIIDKSPKNNEIVNDVEEQKTKLINYQIGPNLKSDKNYLNWLWVSEFKLYNDCEWQEKLSEEFYNNFESTIFNIYENIIR